MADSVLAARSGGAAAVNKSPATGPAARMTRPDAASRVASDEAQFARFSASLESAVAFVGSLSAPAETGPIASVTGPQPAGAESSQADDQRPAGGRRLLAGATPLVLAETQAEEARVLATDPGQADITRAINRYRGIVRGQGSALTTQISLGTP